MRLHSAVAAAGGALMLVLAVPGSASAATGQFRYSYQTADGYDAVGFINNPRAGDASTSREPTLTARRPPTRRRT